MFYRFLSALLWISFVQCAEPTLVGAAGASIPFQVYTAWADSNIAERPNVKIQYNSIGSGIGQELIITGEEIVYAASRDSLLTDEDYSVVPDLQMTPFLSGGIVAFARFQIFIQSILADVFLGVATSIESATYYSFFDSLGSTRDHYFRGESSLKGSSAQPPSLLPAFLFTLLLLPFQSNRSRWSICLVLVIIVASGKGVEGRDELRLAGLFPFSGFLASVGSSEDALARIAVEDWNAEHQDSEDLFISLSSFDTGSNSGRGTKALNTARKNVNPFAIIGCHDEVTSAAVALGSSLYLYPQISYGSRGTVITDFGDFPLFLRMIPAFSSEGHALASLFKLYGVKKVAVIFTADDYGINAAQTFREQLDDDVDATLVQFTAGEAELDSQMEVLRNSLSRIIIMLPGSEEDARTMLREGYRYHLIEEFIWLGGSFTSSSSLYYDPIREETDQLIKGIARGLVSINVAGGTGEKFEEFLDVWETRDPRAYSGAGKRSLPLQSPYAYDSVVLFALAFEAGFESVNGFVENAKSISFDGITGPVQLNEIGNRLALYNIFNLRDSNEGDRGFVKIGTWYEGDAFDITKAYQDDETFGVRYESKIHYHDGTTNIPRMDIRPKVEYWSCDENKFLTNEDGTIRLDKPGPHAEKIADFYHCDKFIDCYSLSDESTDCDTSNYLIVFIIFGVLTGLLILIACCLLPIVFFFGCVLRRVRFRSASPPFLIIIILSIIVGYFSIFAWYGQPHPVACGFQPWLLGLSVISMVAALVAKNLRIWKIFHSPLKRSKVTDFQVFIVWLIMVIPAVFLLFLWTLISTPTATLVERDGRIHYVCETGGFTGPPGGYVFFSLFVLYAAILLIIGAIVSCMTRKVPSLFNESKLIAISIYNLFILSVLIIPIYFVLQEFDPFVGWMIRSFAILYAFTATLALLFVPKIKGIVVDGFKDPSSLYSTGSGKGRNSTQSQTSGPIA